MLVKLYKYIIGLILLPFNLRVFDPRKKFSGKSIAIVGPAKSAFDKQHGSKVDAYDLVIRINKAPFSLSNENAAILGSKTDILFHSFFENNETGGGPIDIALYEKQGINYVIAPRNTWSGWRLIFNFFKKYNKNYTVYMLPFHFYKELISDFGKWRPTMGYCALYSVLASDFSECYITGFTFFRTAYAKGYRDQLIDIDKNKAHIKAQGIHDPDLEFELFVNLLNMKRNKNVKMDKQLTDICNESI